MGATEPRHALIIRVHRLALAGMTGMCLWGGTLGTGPATAGEPGGTTPEPARAALPPPAPAARRAHEPYMFFLGDGRTTHHPPTGLRQGQVPAATAAGQSPRSYLFFVPGKKVAARTSASAIPSANLAIAGVIPAAEGLPLAPSQRSLMFFAPQGSPRAAKPAHPPLASLTARPDLRTPIPLASVERVPVHLPGPPTRRPLPYLIFQPKSLGDRPTSPPKPGARGTSSLPPPPRVSSLPLPELHRPPASRLQAEITPRPTERRPPRHDFGPRSHQAPLGLKPSLTLAALPPLPIVPAPETGRPPARANRTPGPVARDPAVGIVGWYRRLRSR